MFARNTCDCFIKSVMQDCFKTHLDACTTINSSIMNVVFIEIKKNNVARFYKFMRLNNKVCINATDYAARS